MTRVSSQLSQRQRTKNNPLHLGRFDSLSLRLLQGTLGPQYKVQADGYGGGEYNHWFQIDLVNPAWIIATKGGIRPQYINVSFYNLNHEPIIGLNPFDNDSVSEANNADNGEKYYPYLDTFMSVQSDLYNTYNSLRIDRGDDRYFPLNAGSYLLCISSTRNELLNYEVGVVIEFPITELYLGLEDLSVYLREDAIDPLNTVVFESPFTVDTNISDVPGKPNGFTQTPCEINNGVTVTVLDGSEWLIGFITGSGPVIQENNFFLLEYGNESFLETIHDHTLSEWKDAWNRQHQQTDRFPDIFIPLTNRP